MSVDPGKEEPKRGVSTLDMMSMSVPVRRITRLLLRQSRMSYQEICEKLAELPEDKRLSDEEIDQALAELVDLDWLERIEDRDIVVYQVQLKKKAGSDVTRSDSSGVRHASVSGTMDQLWSAVEEGAAEAEGGLKAKKEMSAIHQLREEAHSEDQPDISDMPTQKLGYKKEEKKKGGLLGLLRKKPDHD